MLYCSIIRRTLSYRKRLQSALYEYSTIQTETDGLKGDIALLQSSWTGGASDSMAACAADWHVTAIQVQSSLDLISQALDQAAVSYDDAETTNTTRFGQGQTAV